MERKLEQKFAGGVSWFVKIGTAAEMFLAFLIVVPLTLWFAWAHGSGVAEPVVLSLFCASFVWLNVSILRWQRNLRKLGWKSPSKLSFGLGLRPGDSDELETWSKGRHLRYSFMAVLICMSAFAIVKYLSGDF